MKKGSLEERERAEGIYSKREESVSERMIRNGMRKERSWPKEWSDRRF